MRKDTEIISIYQLDGEKKESIIRYSLEKMLKEIKIILSKNDQIIITIERLK